MDNRLTNENTKAFYNLDDTIDKFGQDTYKYNVDGYLETKTTQTGTTRYNYGSLGELKEVVLSNGDVISYVHNVDNQRVAKLKNGEIIEKYLWFDLTKLLATYDKNNNLLQRYNYADARMPLSFTDSNDNIIYITYNQVGTPMALIDVDGNILKKISYDSFGKIISDSNPSLTIPFSFAGGLYDPDTKLSRFGHRDYDSHSGKWTSKDPIGLAGGDSNILAYVGNNPIHYIDPEGLKVYLCRAPVNGVNVVDHHWLKTDSMERGMWNDNDTKEWYDDIPFAADVAVRDEKYKPDAMCKEMPYADENKVNAQLENLRPLGTWTPWNQCQSFSQDVLRNATPRHPSFGADNHTTNPFFTPNIWVPRSSI